MASYLLKLSLHTVIKIPNPTTSSQSLSRTSPFTSLPNPSRIHHHHHHHHQKHRFPRIIHKPKILCSTLQPSVSTYPPPTTKEEAILQAKTCLSTTLEKPLNNPRLVGKLKKQKQPRFRVEIPVIDDSPSSLTQLTLDFFQDLPIKRKGSKLNILLLWPNPTLANSAYKAFSTSSSPNSIQNLSITSLSTDDLNSADIVVFLEPEESQLGVMKTVSDSLYPKPVVMFNPKWGFDEESEFGELSGFVGSFEVVYSFMGLEVRGVINKRNGVIFKCARDGVMSGEKWGIFVEEESGGLKLISKFKKRPSIGEVENVLYNLMAVNSPLTKSAKFFRDLVSNVTGKK